jgi:hypothetical protein
MKEYGTAPQEKVNQMLAELRVVAGAENSFVAVYTFAHDMRNDIELTPATSVPNLEGYMAEGKTALFSSVKQVLVEARLSKQLLEKAHGTEVLVLLNVLSDGEETVSRGQGCVCRVMAKECCSKGFLLNVTGLGISGEELAEVLGFPVAKAKTFEATSRGLGEAMDAVTEVTSVSFGWTRIIPGNKS